MPLMSQAQYAKHRGCNATYVTKKVKDGTISVKNKLIDSDKADLDLLNQSDPSKAYMAEVNKKQKERIPKDQPEIEKEQTPGYAESRAKRETYMANLAKLEFETRSGRVAPISLLEFALAETCEQIKSILESIPLKVKNRCPELRAQAIEIIRTEIIRAQNAASKARINLPDAMP